MIANTPKPPYVAATLNLSEQKLKKDMIKWTNLLLKK